MGNSESTESFVAKWGDQSGWMSYTGPKCDVIELKTTKKMSITGVAVVRPTSKTAHVTLEIFSLKDDVIVTTEKFNIGPSSNEKVQILMLARERIFHPGSVYRITVLYEGASCLTYEDTYPEIVKEDHYINLRRNLDATSDELYRPINLITGIRFTVQQKGRACC